MRGHVHIVKVLAAASSVIVAILAVGTFLNVISRAAFDSPVPGVVDLAALCLVLAVFLSLGEAEVSEAHVRMQIFTSRMRPRLRNAVRALAMAISTAFLGLMIWASYLRLYRSFQSKEVIIGTIPLNVWPFRFVVMAGLFVMACICLIKCIQYATAATDTGENHDA